MDRSGEEKERKEFIVENHENPSIRTWIYLKILKKPVFRPLFFIFEKVNLIVFHWNLKETTLRRKGKEDKTYYVRRGAGKTDIAGLVGTYYLVGAEIYMAEKLGWIPYVDFEKYPCQYSAAGEIAGTKNAWEYYFEQPCSIKRKDICNGRRIILSGWRLFKSKKQEQLIEEWWNLSRKDRRKFFEQNIPIKQYLKDEVKIFYKKEFYNRKILGVFLRGTDYTHRKPIGHDVQPSVEQVVRKVKEFFMKHLIDRIFLVTEDADIYEQMVEEFKELIFCSDYNFVKFNGQTDKWVKDSFKNDPYERGKNYLIRVMLLSMCDYYVGSKASGSRFALDFGEYKDEYTFELGVY